MKRKAFLSVIIGAAVLSGVLDCHAEKWDRNDYKDNGIKLGFYDADSIKVHGKTVSWTEKYVFTKESADNITASLSKFPACRQNVESKGKISESQVDYQIEKDKIRGVSKRYYNKSNAVICTDKDLGKGDFSRSWNKIERHTPTEKAYYDLVTKYHISLK